MAGKLLTMRKARWVAKRKPDIVRGAPLNNPSILEARYAAKLEGMVRFMADECNKQIRSFFTEPHAEEYFETAMDASVSSQARILTNALMKRFNAYFAVNAPTIAERYMDSVNKASGAAVHQSLKELSGGLSLPTTALSEDMLQVLNASIIENVSLIKSISMEYLAGVQGAVMRSIAGGRGLADLTPYMLKHKEITVARAKNIALDQTRRAYGNLNKARMEKLGFQSYEWLHTGGSAHPRELHKKYSGMIFRWDDPPIVDERSGLRGHPGTAINCRCRARPVIQFKD